ncbi:transcriptional regulator [Kutzneria buriramensis]|uniref:Transcriptional regulator n=1 Tax=Kutzneria buriramensis TaxID=1045776 RepID=A0A3E0GYV0_9PSEU|nr:transcriptional regulator [Kutzneria buriramensis]
MEPRFMILGNTGIRVGGEIRNQWGHTKLRGILAVLLLKAGEFVPMDELVEWVWPDGRAPRDRAGTCYTYIKRVREMLRGVGIVDVIDTNGGAYRIRIDRQEIDFFAFRGAIDRARVVGRRGDHAQGCREIESALELWTERPLADARGDRAAQWRMWSRQQHWIDAHGALTHGLLALGEYQAVLQRLDDLPVEYQSNLTLVKRRIQALRELGRHRDATAYYLRMRKFYRSELDQDEADDLTRFHDALLKRGQGRVSTGEPETKARTEVAPRAPHLLPHDIADFTGRVEVLGELDRLTTSSAGEALARVVVLEGAPGVGKTAVATHWAHRATERFPGGQLYVDLQGFSEGPRLEPADVVDRFLAAFDFPLERVPTAIGRFSKLANLLSGRRALIVLDNAENSRHVQPLLDYLSTCLVLVTSRQRLSGLARRGASHISVAPLDQGESVEWLEKRIGPRAEADRDSVCEVAALCGGNSLSLRLVGEHIVAHPGVPLAEFVEELRAELLDLGDDGDGPDASIRASFSYSLQKLSESERRLFRLLSVHPGADIGLGVAGAVAACEPMSVRRSLDGLLHAHLLSQGASRDRYHVHDLLRQFAASLTSTPEHEAERLSAEERMLSYYLHTANNADLTIFPHRTPVPMEPLMDGVKPESFADDDRAINWFVRERPSLSSLVHFAAECGYDEYVTKLSSCIGEAYQRLGYYGDIFDFLGLAIRAARMSKDSLGEAYSLHNLGFAYLNLRRFDLAEANLLEARRKFGEVDMPEGVAGAVHNLGRVMIGRGEYRQGIEYHLTALEAFRALGAKGHEVIVLYRLGEAHRAAHNLDASISFLRDALWLAERLADRRSQAFSLAELGAAYAERGDFVAAEGYHKRALEISEAIHDMALAAKACAGLALIAQDEESFEEAVRFAQRAVELCAQVRDAKGEATAYDVVAHAQYSLGEREQATRSWRRALAVLEDLGDPLADVVRRRLAEATAFLPVGPPTQGTGEDVGLPSPRTADGGSPEEPRSSSA